MNNRLIDLLIKFDEMGFAPTIPCPDVEKTAITWKESVIEEIKSLETENAELKQRVKAAELIAETAAHVGIDRISKLKHRAEVAERALDKATELAYEYRTEMDTLSCSSCDMFDEIFPRCKERGLYEECSKRWKEALIEQAEKELAEVKE